MLRECLQANHRKTQAKRAPHQAPSKNPSEPEVQIRKMDLNCQGKERGNRTQLSHGDRSLGELARQ